MANTKILLPVVHAPSARADLELAVRLLHPQGKIIALNVVRVPEANSLSEGAGEAVDSRAALEELHTLLPDQRVELKTLVKVSRSVTEGIAESAAAEGADLLLLPWKGSTNSEVQLFGRTIDKLVESPPCNLLVSRVGELSNCKHILLPVRGGPYTEFAMQIASQLAQSFAGEITVLHCEQPFVSPEFGHALYGAFIQRLRFQPQVKRVVTVRGDPKEAILQEAADQDLVIIGAGAMMEPSRSFSVGRRADREPRKTAFGPEDSRAFRRVEPRSAPDSAQIIIPARRSVVCRKYLSPPRVRGAGQAGRAEAETGRHHQFGAARAQ
jgi:nucleotide-binding universal stress UspA family protein